MQSRTTPIKQHRGVAPTTTIEFYTALLESRLRRLSKQGVLGQTVKRIKLRTRHFRSSTSIPLPLLPTTFFHLFQPLPPLANMMYTLSFVLAAFAVGQSTSPRHLSHTATPLTAPSPPVAAVPAIVKPITTTEAHAVTTILTELEPVITTRPHTTVFTETQIAPVTRVTTLTVDGHPSIATVRATTTFTNLLTEVTAETATTTLTALSTATFFTTGPVTTTVTVGV